MLSYRVELCLLSSKLLTTNGCLYISLSKTFPYNDLLEILGLANLPRRCIRLRVTCLQLLWTKTGHIIYQDAVRR